MSEQSATQRRVWAHIRLALKGGRVTEAAAIIDEANKEMGSGFCCELCDRVATIFTAGCAIVGDPAPTKENDHE